MKKLLLLTVFFVSALNVFSQDFSNKGKDFWVAYGYHQVMTNGNGQQMVLYFATDQVTNITITVPGNGYTQTLTSGPLPTVLTSAPIPKAGAQDSRLLAESTTPENKGIHIVADKPIVAYAHIYNQNVSGASILFPTNTLGKEYYSVNFTNNSNTNNANCWFYIVATDPGTTTVEITPSNNTINRQAGIPFTVDLTQGQVYNLMGQLTGQDGNVNTGVDLTGSKIRSIASATGGCKKIAVFSGSGRIAISCNGTAPSSDNYMVQSFPKSAWGKKYLTVHTSSLINNIYRICVADPATVVTVNGAPIAVPLQNGFYYEIAATSAHLEIEANLPITVAQYITSQGACGNPLPAIAPGDPEVIYLSPVEQNIAKVLWNATPNFNITRHFFNVVIPNTGTAISSFKLDGVAINPSLFTVHPQDPGFSYLIQSVGAGPHNIESDSGFNAIAYGFGNAESYGYNAGTNIKDLYNFLTPINPLSISPDPVACTGTSFYFSVTFPFQPTSLIWNFYNSPNLFPNSTTVNIADASTILDGTYFIGTRQVWRYKLPNLYNYIPSNISPGYPVTITAGTTNVEGCGNSFERDFNLAVYDPPSAAFTYTNNGCITDSFRFTDVTSYVAGTFSYKWFWDFGDGNTSAVRNPVHRYLVPGTYIVKFALISNVGCLSDTARQTIVVSPLPLASLTGTTTVCQNAPAPNITFTGIVGTAPFKFTYNINGGPEQTALTTSGNAINVAAPTNLTGTYVYNLIGVQGENCYQNQSLSSTIVVNPLPSATMTGNATVCQNSVSPLITFTGSGATAPYTFTYKINGGADLTVTTTTGNSVSVPVPTGAVASFVYTLVSVRDGSSTACSRSQTATVTVTINGLPTATISGTTSVCNNAPSPFVTFTGANGIAPYTFTYSINSGPNQVVTTTSGNSVNVPIPTSTSGTFVYSLVNVKESSSTACSQPQTGSVTVVIFPTPVANFSSSLPSCINRTISFTDISIPGAGSISDWTWNFGDGSPVELTQNPVHTFETSGTFPVKLSIKTSNGCQSAVATIPVIVNPRPKAGYINPEVCLSDTYAQFIDTSSVAGGTIAQWLWDFDHPSSGALNSSTLQNPTHSYSTIGTKNVKLIVTSNSGCRDTVTQTFFVNGDIPVAGFSVLNENSLCVNDSVRIVNTSTVNVGSVVKVEIYWDNVNAPGTFVTDDNPFPGKQYTHLYPLFNNPPLNKVFQVRFRAYSGETCINDKLLNITVNAAPKVVFDNIPDTCLYVDPFQILQANEISGVPGTFVYTGPGVSSSGIFDPSIVGPGSYTIRYYYTSDKGCVDSGQKVIKILNPPLAKFGFSKPTCETKTVTFSDSSSAPIGALTTWTWDFGDGTPIVVKTSRLPFTHTFAAAGTYDVKLIVTTNKGCNSLQRTIPVKVNPLPQVSFTFSDTACLPHAFIQFNSTSTIADNTESSFLYTWNFGDGSPVSLSPNPSHIYTNLGPHPVKLTIKSGAQCVSETIIDVNTIHPRPIAGIDFSKPSVCVGNSIQFLDASDPRDGNNSQWYWDLGDATISSQQSPVHSYANAGTYIINHYIVNSFGCFSDTLPKPFTVYPYPVVNAGDDKLVLEGESVVLTSTAIGTGLTYSWTKDLNVNTNLYLNNPTLLSPVCTPVDDIFYTLTVTGSGGCPSTDQVKVKVLKTPRIPNTFSPNGDGINDKWEIEYLKMYPYAKVQVFTRTGQQVFQTVGYGSPWDGTINGKLLPVDTYYYIIEPESGRKPVTGYVTIIK